MTEKSSIDIFNENYTYIESRIAEACERVGKKREDVILLAATKTVDTAVINHAIKSGIEYIGENRVQELLSKEETLLPDAHRHFIGHLQTNKVKDIVGRVEMIESVHSEKLAAEINRASLKKGIVTDILLEVNIGDEESKSGFTADSLPDAVRKIAEYEAVRIKGLMAIPPICEKKEEITAFFNQMHKLFVDIGDKKIDNVIMEYLSMGMSGDYYEAILSGSNIVRLGTALFGQRNYNI